MPTVRHVKRIVSPASNKKSEQSEHTTSEAQQTLTPTSSTSILSSPTGPREVLTMLAIDTAAMTGQGGGGGGGERGA